MCTALVGAAVGLADVDTDVAAVVGGAVEDGACDDGLPEFELDDEEQALASSAAPNITETAMSAWRSRIGENTGSP